jgi:undecaprenyl-diphosphatase
MNSLFLLSLFGVLQGCTEVFPFSSSGHTALARLLFGHSELTRELLGALQLGPLAAIVSYFRKDLLLLWSSSRSSLPHMRWWMRGGPNPFSLSGEQNLFYLMSLSIVPVIVEAWLMDHISSRIFEQGRWVALFLLISAILLRIITLRSRGERTLKELGLRDFLVIVLAQGLAMLPGVSGLGILICAGLWLGMNLQEAVKLAFLQLIAVLAGSLLLLSADILALLKSDPTLLTALIPAIVLAAVISFVGLRFLMSLDLDRPRLAFFSSYCLMIGLTSFIYLQF